jgi:hypothetical protein
MTIPKCRDSRALLLDYGSRSQDGLVCVRFWDRFPITEQSAREAGALRRRNPLRDLLIAAADDGTLLP